MSKKSLQISPEALWRYQWVAQIDARVLAGEALPQAIAGVQAHPRRDPRGRERRPSVRTLYRWVAAYREAGLAGLEPRERPRVEASRVLAPELLGLLRTAKAADPELSVPDLIALARQEGVLGAEEPVCRTTVWRACRRLGLPLSRAQALETADTRRFAYPHRMMMVLADGKHFRAGAQRLRRVALSLLDDATRFGLAAVVGPSETTELFLSGLHQLACRHGLPDALYLDHGPGFVSHDTEAVLARLGRRLVHGRARYPEGHGKIERYHRTLKHKLLRTLDGHPETDPDCGALTLRLLHWLREVYNHTPHESLGGETPAERFHRDERPLQLPRDRPWLDAQFQTTEERTVSKDHVVSLDGTLHEVPRACRGRIAITRHLLTGTLTVRADGREVEIHPLEPTKNAFDRRARPTPLEPREASEPAHPKTPAATPAQRAFDDDFGPLVGPDGDYPETLTEPEED
jgi:putative transposase